MTSSVYSQRSQRTKQIALLAVFSALYIVLRFIPFSILIGSAGAYLSFSDFLAPIIGILLGPYLGGLSIIIGNFGAIGLGRGTTFPTLFGAVDFLPDFVAAVSAGFLVRRNWIPVVALNAGLLALFFVDPLTSIFVTVPGTSISIPFAWLHIASFVVLIASGWIVGKWIEAGSKAPPVITPQALVGRGQKYYWALKRRLNWFFGNKLLVGGLIIVAFVATMMQHLAGNILFEVAYGQINPPIIPLAAWPAEWTGVLFAYPIERTILIVAAVIIGTPLIRAVARSHYLHIGKQEKPKSTDAKAVIS